MIYWACYQSSLSLWGTSYFAVFLLYFVFVMMSTSPKQHLAEIETASAFHTLIKCSNWLQTYVFRSQIFFHNMEFLVVLKFANTSLRLWLVKAFRSSGYSEEHWRSRVNCCFGCLVFINSHCLQKTILMTVETRIECVSTLASFFERKHLEIFYEWTQNELKIRTGIVLFRGNCQYQLSNWDNKNSIRDWSNSHFNFSESSSNFKRFLNV